ncbi:MAG: nucleotidyl transferase AbiEii/AbiGii toxin family protein [Caldilineaceae bacterium]|nr:nucleotidyl transferase AbiEii/AbiGii toxin family protein [Caldilineaceae bacterium]MBP8108900.1 nucleotidyl transferase AbiEii/AbiGii toxin family protein [Caldilineaceae bacterium]MBP8122915.1 nucleotidyl transferase AbiEii/AbiGii toxin family protein [Caldilineaceae bacterium]MBP9073039.1 nucleotidyl transferase AbiEii/AbiGii toxin family protein [Caldilineaceae bacterium]
MLNADVLTFKEFMMHEPLPLSTLHRAVLDFLRGRDDVVLFGAQAVNAYVSEPRMTQDVDLMSNRARALAEELKQHLHGKFQIAIRVREIGEGKGYRIYQVQSGGNRHLVDLRPVESLPLARRIEQVWVMAPAELIASKVISYHQRRGKPKSGTDWRDLALLLLTFPDLKQDASPVATCLQAAGADAEILDVWRALVRMEIEAEDEDDEF